MPRRPMPLWPFRMGVSPSAAPSYRRIDVPEGLWHKCPSCGEVIHEIELRQELRVCRHCGHHFPMPSDERAAGLADPDWTMADILLFIHMVHGVVIGQPERTDAPAAVARALSLIDPRLTA